MNRLSDATLNGMTKKQLIEYVRMCEHNYDIAEETLRQQAENVKDWRPVKHGKWKIEIDRFMTSIYRCTVCGTTQAIARGVVPESVYGYCPKCGAKMCGGDSDGDQV